MKIKKFIKRMVSISMTVSLLAVLPMEAVAENLNTPNYAEDYQELLPQNILNIENIVEQQSDDSIGKIEASGLMQIAADGAASVSYAKSSDDKNSDAGKTVTFTENFDNISDGKLPQGWELSENSASKTEIVNGTLRFNTLADEGINGRRLLFPDIKVQDGSEIVFEADLRFAAANDRFRWSGLVYGYKDESHWWQLVARKISTAENGVELNRMADSLDVIKRGWTKTDMPDNTMRHFKLEIKQGRASSYIDDELISSVPYSGSMEGRLGLINKGIDLYVDNISIKIKKGKAHYDYKADLYRPKTSIVSVPTVVAKAGVDAKNMATATRRPSNIIVYPDSSLKVYSADGKLISDSLDEFYEKTAGTLLPIIYLKNSSAESAVKAWIDRNSIMDISVMADSSNAGLVRNITSSSENVRGIVRFDNSSLDLDKDGKISNKELWNVVYTTNFNFGKIAVLESKLATRENIAYIQRRLTTVWVESDGVNENICSAINAGADGIISSEPIKVLDVLESPMYSSVPVVSRPMNIAGHRGQPVTNTENTLSGAIRAITSGANAVECDIWLTEDGVLAINHDKNTGGLYNKWLEVEASVWKQLSGLGFKKPKNLRAGEGMARLDQYYQTFKNRDAIIFVELKSTRKVGVVTALRRLTQELGMESQIVVISFDENLLSMVKKEWQGIPTGLLEKPSLNSDISNGIASVASKNWRLGTVWQPSYIGGDENMRKLREAAAFRGMGIWSWTSKNVWQMDAQLFEGISGVTTNSAYTYGEYPVSLSQEDVTGSKVRLSPSLMSYDRNVKIPSQTDLIVLSGNAPEKNSDGSYSTKSGTATAMLRYTQHTSSGQYYIYSNIFKIKQS